MSDEALAWQSAARVTWGVRSLFLGRSLLRARRWLFGTANRSNFARDLAKACAKAGVPVFSSHMLGRHSIATRILTEEGKSLAFLNSAGRWKSLKAVERYTHLSRSEVADEVKQMGAKWKARRKEEKILPLDKSGR